MFKELKIQNFALIEQSDIIWNEKLNILTGETGAGKSILISALKLILGQKADSKLLKNPDKKCIIEAIFDISKLNINEILESNDIDYEDNIILRREILKTGKSRAFINDSPVTLDTLKLVSNNLVSIHSQFETLDLLDEKFQMDFLDQFANNQNLIKDYKKLFEDFKIKSKLKINYIQEFDSLKKETDYNNFLISELNEVNFEEINLEELENKIKTFEHSEKIISELDFSNQTFQNEQYGIINLLNNIIHKLEKISIYSNDIKNITERLKPTLIEIEDLDNEIVNIAQSFELNPEEINIIQNNFNKIQFLLKKHQVNSINDLKIIKNQLINKSLNFETFQEKIDSIEEELLEIQRKLDLTSQKLHKKRIEKIPILSDLILKQIGLLAMEKASIDFELIPSDSFNQFGKETLNINFSANLGINKKPLDKAVSGGERSRIMLVFKNILNQIKNLPTLIFDEIDTGISGKIANEMGKMIENMSENSQILVITHLPQMASKGKSHYKVFKYQEENQINSSIIQLSDKERINEIATLLSGDNITESAIKQAEELMNQ